MTRRCVSVRASTSNRPACTSMQERRAGAKALGLNHKAGTLERAELPPDFELLNAREIEDVLSSYRHS